VGLINQAPTVLKGVFDLNHTPAKNAPHSQKEGKKLNKYILVLTTVPDEKTGQKIARQLVKEKLSACVTVSAASQSFYWWQRKISKEKEHVLFIKTKASLFADLEKKIEEVHPYEVPEIIALPFLKGSAKYLNWIERETKD
jgi:periplasmic divalent cation tolerance protein